MSRQYRRSAPLASLSSSSSGSLAASTCLRALAETFVPEITDLDEAGWKDVLGHVERVLDSRPASVRRQVLLLVGLLDWLPVARHGRRFVALDPRRRTGFLQDLQHSRLLLLRRGIWGLRTLVFLGFYGRVEVGLDIGYRAHPDGWEARARAPASPGDAADPPGR